MSRGTLREALRASGLNISLNSLGKYERGESAPDIDSLREIAAALQASYFYIDDKLRVEFSRNGTGRPEPVAQQLSLDFDDKNGVTVRIESSGARLILSKFRAG